MSPLPFRAGASGAGTDRLSDLPFSWVSDDLSLEALSGQVGAFAWASTVEAAQVDAVGNVWFGVHSLPRWDMLDDPVTGRRLPGLILDPFRTNLVVRSKDLADAAWINIGTPSPAASVTTTIGELQLSTFGDNDGAALEGKRQVIPFTGTAVRTLTFHIRASTSTSSVIRLRQTTGTPADKLLLVVTWTGSVPTLTISGGAGTVIGKRLLANGAYEVRVLTLSVVGTETNQLELYPATTSGLAVGNTGNLEIGGIAAYEKDRGLSYVETPAGSSVSSSGETLDFPFLLPRRTGRLWLYESFWELGGRYVLGAGSGYGSVGDVTTGGAGFYPNDSGPGYAAFHQIGGAGPVATQVGSFAAFGTFVELLLTMETDGKPRIEVAHNGVSLGSTLGSTSPSDMTSDWAAAFVRLGRFGASAGHIVGGAAYRAMKVGLGTTTLTKARGYR